MQHSNPMGQTGLFNDPINIILQKFKTIEEAAQKDENGHESLAREVYLYTKDFLESNSSNLSPVAKGKILTKYIKLWEAHSFSMEISDTSYADQYSNSIYTIIHDRAYRSSTPMLAGFDLQNAKLSKRDLCHMILLSVKFRGADFSGTWAAYAHFENCDLTQIKTDEDTTNFNKCIFKKCNLADASMITNSLCSTNFIECNITNTVFGSRVSEKRDVWFEDCVNNGVIKQFGI